MQVDDPEELYCPTPQRRHMDDPELEYDPPKQELQSLIEIADAVEL
jgi:hypothetical protein